MSLRPITALLFIGCLSVAVYAASQSMGMSGASAFAQEVLYAAPPQNDFQKARALLKAGDSKRLNRDYAGAKKLYEGALSGFQAARNNRFATAAQQMLDVCEAMPIAMSKLKNGTYEGTDKGFSSDITISVDVKSGRIKTLRIVSQKESRPLKSLEIVPRAVVSRQSPSVDTVTGATITSYTVMSATVKALQKAAPDAQD
jgi:uncharacterized protein with FMN-binding domain